MEKRTQQREFKSAPEWMEKNIGWLAEWYYCGWQYNVERMPNNIPGTVEGDYNGEQIKTSGCTIGNGTNLNEIIDRSGAQTWTYVTKDFKTAYNMTKDEFKWFALKFGRVTTKAHEPNKLKWRLREETKKMIEYLEKNSY